MLIVFKFVTFYARQENADNSPIASLPLPLPLPLPLLG